LAISKIINKKYIKNNRKITVRVGTQNSTTRPLDNGISQGSPISVVLFIIAFNKLAKTLISAHMQTIFYNKKPKKKQKHYLQPKPTLPRY